ncbi:Fasciclin domain protein 3 [Pseudozyma hubeiensis]|nr:Fasciclin domain protein 3 [Pseudozyma hubeiensis]
MAHASLASANNKQANSQPSNSPSNSVKTPFLTGVHHPTNDSASASSISLLNFNNNTTSHSTPSAAAAVQPISLRAHLEAAISNPSSTSAQANLLKQLQTTLAAIRPSSQTHAVATPPSSTVHSTTPAHQHTFARVPSITPAAVASALAAAAAGRRHTLPSTPVPNSAAAITTSHVTKAQTQRLEQIRYYQQLIAQLNATMPASADSSVPTLPFEARPMDSVKTDGTGFNAAAFGLNPMSADDPSWIGHGFQAQAADDFLSSPEWTDPSPALTDSMSFEIDSCGPSPLLPLDSYEDDLGVPGIAGAPLFPPQDGYASSNVSPLELAHHDFGASTVGDFGAPEMGSDFTLFPDTKPARLPIEMAFSKLNKPAAGTGASTEDPAMTLLRALSSAALSNSSSTASVAVTNSTTAMASSTPALTASPLAFTSMAAPSAPAPALASTVSAPALAPAPSSSESSRPALERRSSSMSSSSCSTKAATTDSRGTKRRMDSTDLLPLDAPIQKRTYYAVSATSRRDTAPTAEVDEFAEEEAAIRREKDPRVAKRLSNTLAARRSRHRKAEELRLLHEKIEALSGEVESWKRRCELAEKERDDARALLS